MHKKLLNEATLYLTVSAEGPLLVKSGTEGWDPAIPDMQFVRTRHASLGETVFIPGSSLKGTMRSYSEKIARTLGVVCCDPFDEQRSCSKRLERFARESNAPAIYRNSCVACKLYGSTNMAGRAAFADAYPTHDLSPHLTTRTAVAIDRVLGSVAVGPFDFEALMRGEFATHIRVRNFELWQLGLLGLVVRDLCLNRIRIGYGKSRGLGSVAARLNRLELRAMAADGLVRRQGTVSIKGVGAWLHDTELEQYGIGEAEKNPVDIATQALVEDDLIGVRIALRRQPEAVDWCAPEAQEFFSQCVKSAWTSYARDHQVGG